MKNKRKKQYIVGIHIWNIDAQFRVYAKSWWKAEKKVCKILNIDPSCIEFSDKIDPDAYLGRLPLMLTKKGKIE